MNPKTLTPEQFNKHFKHLTRDPHVAELMEVMLYDFCIKTNGTVTPFNINKEKYTEYKFKDGTTDSRVYGRTNRLMRDLELIKMVKEHKVGEWAKFYVLSGRVLNLLPQPDTSESPNPIFDGTDPEIEKEIMDNCIKYGINPNQSKICPCCGRAVFLTEFNGFKITESKIWLKRICDDCDYQDTGKVLNIDAWNTVWSFAKLIEEPELKAIGLDPSTTSIQKNFQVNQLMKRYKH